MSVFFNGHNAPHANGFGQHQIERMNHPLRVNKRRVGFKMGKLLLGVYARVGAATAHQINGLAKNFGQRVLNFFLYRGRVLLFLPTVKIRPVVPQFDKIPHGAKIAYLILRNFVN